MGDIVDDLGNLMPAPGNGRAKRARIDKEGNFVAGGGVYAYNTSITPPIRYPVAVLAVQTIDAFGGIKDDSSATARAANDVAIAAAFAQNNCVAIFGKYYFSATITVPDANALFGCSRNLDIITSNASPVILGGGPIELKNLSIEYDGDDLVTSIGIQTSTLTGQAVIENVTVGDVAILTTNPAVAIDVRGSQTSITSCWFFASEQCANVSGTNTYFSRCRFTLRNSVIKPNVVNVSAANNSFFQCALNQSGNTATTGINWNSQVGLMVGVSMSAVATQTSNSASVTQLPLNWNTGNTNLYFTVGSGGANWVDPDPLTITEAIQRIAAVVAANHGAIP